MNPPQSPQQNFFEKPISRGIFTKETARVWYTALASVLFLCGTLYFLWQAPANFPAGKVITVKDNSSLNALTGDLYEMGVIKSKFWFRTAVIAMSGEKGVMAGDYIFAVPRNVLTVAARLTKGEFGLTPIKVTFPEGITAKKMSVILKNQLTDFDDNEFLRLAVAKEGYLFPDTYLFLPNVKPKEIVKALETNFIKQTNKIQEEIKNFGISLSDVVIMASIIEAEARTDETRKIIAGILWKRLGAGMPLQVDAPFEYIIGKNTFQLTTKDLKTDSPYNTYLYKGLPPTAIGNPGLASILATITPTKSAYFYYLSDIRGEMHYAKTYAEHLVFKAKYVDN